MCTRSSWFVACWLSGVHGELLLGSLVLVARRILEQERALSWTWVSSDAIALAASQGDGVVGLVRDDGEQ